MPQVPTRQRPEPGGPGRVTTYGSANRTPAGRRPKRRRDPLWARLVVLFGAVLMLASGVTVVGGKALIGRYTEGLTQQNLLGGAAKTETSPGQALKGPINLLLLGVDERARSAGEMRSDTIIILHVPASHDQAYLVSVPRDLWVEVPPFAKAKFGGGHHKMTEAFYFGSRNGLGRAGGAELVAMTINKLTGITFNGAAIIDFNGFKGVIDALDGVRMCVDQRVKSAHMRMVNGKPTWLAEARKVGGGEIIWHEKGCKDMAGWEALDYARQRYGLKNSDYDRQRHQQQLIKAMVKKAMTAGVVTNLPKLDKLIKAAGKAFVLDTNGVPIEDFIFTLKGVAANDLVMIRTNGGKISPANVQGTSAEALTQTSVELFEAVKKGRVGEFVAAHPDFVASEK
ncbi:LCP family protein [Rhizomonospora bruguierae]|uniref:LCP family protein n=1 Tax=Rhizomonospora bruguierae TaxID=1581705 RepID=UPI001BCE62C5|nr:LCP family protein [Micromonospora sp. NBRC 107566]